MMVKKLLLIAGMIFLFAGLVVAQEYKILWEDHFEDDDLPALKNVGWIYYPEQDVAGQVVEQRDGALFVEAGSYGGLVGVGLVETNGIPEITLDEDGNITDSTIALSLTDQWGDPNQILTFQINFSRFTTSNFFVGTRMPMDSSRGDVDPTESAAYALVLSPLTQSVICAKYEGPMAALAPDTWTYFHAGEAFAFELEVYYWVKWYLNEGDLKAKIWEGDLEEDEPADWLFEVVDPDPRVEGNFTMFAAMGAPPAPGTGDQYYLDDIVMTSSVPSAPPVPINVTLQLNTSTNLDTLGEDAFVEVRGALNEWQTGPVLPGDKIIDWNTDSDLDMVNVGGDYWEVTFQMMSDDTLRYKFWTGHTSELGTHPGGGWEGPFDNTIADTRILITGTEDMVVPVQYYNPDLGTGAQPQWKKPFVSKADTVAIYFRVNMGGEMEGERFDPTANGPIGMRGDPTNSGGTIDWGETRVILNWEENSIYDGSFWSGVAYFDKASVTEGGTQEFKFFAENTPDFSWEDGDNHVFTYPVGLADTTIHWTWFSGKKITGVVPIESIITWRVSTEALEAIGLFDRGVGDEIEIRGARGWGEDQAVQLYYQPLLKEWTSANEVFKFPVETEISYKYFVDWDTSRHIETSPNYIAGLLNEDETTRGWEEPAITGGGNRTHVYQNAAEQTAVGDFGFDRQFFNSVPANGVFDHGITVTWSVDMSNAADADSNAVNADNLFTPGVDSVFVRWDGELLAITQGQEPWGDGGQFLELTDSDGDMVYEGTYEILVSEKFPNGWYQLGYVIAYTTDEAGAYVTNGGGYDFGRRYMQYIHPTAIQQDLTTVWSRGYTLPTVQWRPEDLFVEFPPPDMTQPMAVETKQNKFQTDFALHGNYPNPFNPTTTINYTMGKDVDVSIKVYSITGELVETLVNGKKAQGNHSIEWNGKNIDGDNVASGMYFVKMVSGDFNHVTKMMLVR